VQNHNRNFPSNYGDRERDYDDGYNDDWKAMRGQDWNRITLKAWASQGSKLKSKTDFYQAFSELLSLLQHSGHELQHSTMRTILRFLVVTEPFSDTSWKLIRKIYKSKEYEICHIEVIALTKVILNRVANYKGVFSLLLPLYKYENYLFIVPNALTTLLDMVVSESDNLGPDFVREFETCWQNIHSQDGREAFYHLMIKNIENNEYRKKLIKISIDSLESTERNLMTLLCVYSAYLVSSQDGEFRLAYDMLYAVESLHSTCDASIKDEQEKRDRIEDIEREREQEEDDLRRKGKFRSTEEIMI